MIFPSGVTLRFTAARRDPTTGYYVMGQRSYDWGVGRFSQADPLPSSVTDLNRYAYVGCNPTNATDPTGTQTIDPFDPNFWDPLGRAGPCQVATLGFGAGLIIGGLLVDLGSAALELPSGGIATPLVAAGLLSGTSTALTGLALVGRACF